MDILGWELNLTRKIFQLSRLFNPTPVAAPLPKKLNYS